MTILSPAFSAVRVFGGSGVPLRLVPLWLPSSDRKNRPLSAVTRAWTLLTALFLRTI